MISSLRSARHLLAVLTCLACAPALAAAQAGEGLEILLSNADGFESAGIRSLQAALVAAGHRVTIVAPLDDRNATGMGLTTRGTIDYYRQDGGVWAVDGTPADAVTLGLVHVLRETPPNLVIVGSSFGQSVGADVMTSGTVGAAMTAARAGVPAIAVSVAVDLREEDRPIPFQSTTEAFAPAADFVVEVVRQLSETGGAGLLDPRQVLNINYPAVGAAAPDGVRFATVSSLRAFRQVFSVAGDTGPARVELAHADAARAEEGSDLALVSAGFVTVSLLDGDWGAGAESWEPLRRRLVVERQ